MEGQNLSRRTVLPDNSTGTPGRSRSESKHRSILFGRQLEAINSTGELLLGYCQNLMTDCEDIIDHLT